MTDRHHTLEPNRVEIDTSLRCDNLRAIRDHIAEILTGYDSTFVHDVQLVTTELAANACDHADQPRHLWLRREVHDGRGAELVVEVRDATPERSPVVGVSRIAPERGNGMKMVEAFCTDWGVRNDEDAKIVWGRIPIP
ncbi:ATP-binding protein [Umezawaea sp. Da 62-37]|uniref:ATP-binding protein n=1 Tax=Umezawaea sp. Da 62-37 TaxID=3075927 RepID=UPI0028F6EA38|nr:ATP-binding protein [Umezawaea sp. Da 62-37]WNV87869.1 ATP-binding protein [Umezawaea sp. Da 62-37]